MRTKPSKILLSTLSCVALALNCLAQSPAPASSENAVAMVSGQAIYEDEISSPLQSQMRQFRNQEYELKTRILEGVINQKLVEAEAKKRAVPAEKLLQEIDSKIADPTDGEVEAYYLGQKDRINRPLDEVKTQLRQSLKQARVQQARQDYFKSLRDKNEVVILLRPPKIEVTVDPERVRGKPGRSPSSSSQTFSAPTASASSLP